MSNKFNKKRKNNKPKTESMERMYEKTCLTTTNDVIKFEQLKITEQFKYNSKSKEKSISIYLVLNYLKNILQLLSLWA